MRVILDTNILLSSMISPSGTPAKLIDAWLDRRFKLVSHALQLDEFREATRRDRIRRFINPADAGRLVNQIVLLAELPLALPPAERSRDPRDDFLLALCEAGKADWLVTGDKHDLLGLERHGCTRIAGAAAFAATLNLVPRPRRR